MDNKTDFNLIRGKQTLNERFENMMKYTDMVINKVNPSLLITGGPGTGKTFMVRKRINESGKTHGINWRLIKGSASAVGLYAALYHHSDQLIVFDDCDQVLKDPDAVNMLKAALDSYDTREISYLSGRPIKNAEGDVIPSSFEFTGQVIFISNMPEAKIDSAIKSRSFVVNIDSTPGQMLDRMETLLEKVEPNVQMNIKIDALKALKEAYAKFDGVELNMRSLMKAIRIRKMNFENWQWMIAEQCIPNVGTVGVNKKGTSTANGGKVTKAMINVDRRAGMKWGPIQAKYGISTTERRKIMA